MLLKNGLIETSEGPLVLLFFDGYDLKARSGLKGTGISFAHHHMRRLKRSLLGQQVHTGFYTAFKHLRDGLRSLGCNVKVNDFSLAHQYPGYPVGVAGCTSALTSIELPNPRIFGPGDFGSPPQAADLASDDRYVRLIQPSEWFSSLYEPFCKDKIWTWFAGLDAQQFTDLSRTSKTYDFLVYDKFYWQDVSPIPHPLASILHTLEARGHTYTVLKYGEHRHVQFMKALKQSRSMLFLCGHETQGMAYQEALASNIPVLAWDEGIMNDPALQPYITKDTNVSSVPYFDHRCGRKFKLTDFAKAHEAFCSHHAFYEPREFLVETLSSQISSKAYLLAYQQIASAN